MKACKLLPFLLLLLNLTGFSQKNTAYFNAYAKKDGLPSYNCLNTFQDSRGLIWIATDQGVSRFNGYKFSTFFNDPKKNIYLSGASQFYEDTKGRLWVISDLGYLYNFDQALNAFVNIPHEYEDGWKISEYHDILEIDDKLWISSYGALQYLDEQLDSLVVYDCNKIRAPESWPHEEKVRLGIMHHYKNKIYCSTRKIGLVEFDMESEEFSFFRFKEGFSENGYLTEWIVDFEALSPSVLLILNSHQHLITLNLDTQEIIDIIDLSKIYSTKEEVSYTDLQIIDDSTVWLATEKDGLLLIDFKASKIKEHYLNDSRLNGLASNSISSIKTDRQNNLWVCSNTLQLGSEQLYSTEEIKHKSGDPSSLKNDDVFWMSKSINDELLISTSQGLSIYNPKSKEINNSYKVSSRLKNTWAVMSTKDSSLWISSDRSLCKVNPETLEAKLEIDYFEPIDSIDNTFRKAMRLLEDSKGNIWIIDNWNRLKVINAKNDQIVNFPELIRDEETEKFIQFECFIEDADKNGILAGSNIGLFFIGSDHSIKDVDLNLKDFFKREPTIDYLFSDTSERLWSIINGEVYTISLSDKTISKFGVLDQYQIASCNWIVEEPKNCFWFGTPSGIIRYLENEDESSFYLTENISGLDFTAPSSVSIIDGLIYFAGHKGVSILNPEYLKFPGSVVDVKLTDFLINQVPSPFKEEKGNVYNLSLNYNQNDIEFYFSTLEFENQGSTIYAYKTSTDDKQWRELGKANNLKFNNLQPGIYNLKIKAKNASGKWSENICKINLEIKTPWQRTWWFRLFVFIAAVSFLLYLQNLSYRKKLERQKELQKLRIKISSDLHDDVGSLLSGIAMQSEILDSKKTTKDEQDTLVMQMQVMSRQAMERMRDIVWAMDSRKDKFFNLIERMEYFAYQQLNNLPFTYEFHTNKIDEKSFINPDVRQNIYLIYKEAITNSIKHSNGNHIDVYLKLQNDHIVMTIRDNGKVGHEKINKSGLGLSNMEMRSKKINGTLDIDHSEGFKVILSVPVTSS